MPAAAAADIAMDGGISTLAAASTAAFSFEDLSLDELGTDLDSLFSSDSVQDDDSASTSTTCHQTNVGTDAALMQLPEFGIFAEPCYPLFCTEQSNAQAVWTATGHDYHQKPADFSPDSGYEDATSPRLRRRLQKGASRSTGPTSTPLMVSTTSSCSASASRRSCPVSAKVNRYASTRSRLPRLVPRCPYLSRSHRLRRLL